MSNKILFEESAIYLRKTLLFLTKSMKGAAMFSLGKKTLASLMALSVLLSPLSMSLGTLFQTNEIFAQSNYPEIMHMPLMTAPDNINLTVTARMMDRETSTPGDLVSELAYSADNKTTWATTSGSHIGNGYFQFTVS